MNEDKIIKKLLDHDDQFTKVREEIKELRCESLRDREEMITILRRLDQERIFTTNWIDRIENEVENHRQEIIKLKQALNIA